MTRPEEGQKHDVITCQIFKGVRFLDWYRLGFFFYQIVRLVRLLYQGVVSILHRPYCFKRTTCTTVELARAGC